MISNRSEKNKVDIQFDDHLPMESHKLARLAHRSSTARKITEFRLAKRKLSSAINKAPFTADRS